MNYKMISYIMGQISKVEAALLIISLVVSAVYGEDLLLAFSVPALALLALGIPLTLKKPQKKSFYAKEGFIVVALSWFLLSVFGALPFCISGEIPSFIDAYFETVSGFTTTGATIVDNVEAMSHGLLFWRSFTHWIGGMGVLVFVLAIFPQQETQSIFLMKAESPGPKVGKIVSKLKVTARILYGIYVVMTAVQVVLLLLGGMPLFDSIVNSFATAGTGGFAIKSTSIAAYNSAYIEYVIAIFMVLFSINFNVFYLLLIGRVREALKSEEMWVYLGVIASSTAIIAVNISNLYSNIGDTVRTAFFQVASVISTTGFSTVDFNKWPELSKMVLIMLMFFGACAGSTGGGIKIARIILLVKSGLAELKRCISPNSVVTVKFEGKPVENDVVRSTSGYMTAYLSIMAVSLLLVSIDGFDFESTFTAVLTCIGNVGPGMGVFGPLANFSALGTFSKLVLSFDMIAGRLELFPVLLLFSPNTYKNW